MKKTTAQNLIDKTRDDYNRITPKFHSTRQHNWPDIALAFSDLRIKKGAKVLDAGCGNGRAFRLFEKEIEYHGLDISKELLSLAKKDNPSGSFTEGNLTELPFKESSFDIVICISALHHIPSQRLREQTIREIYRVLKPGGQALISNWYFWKQRKYLKQIFKCFFSLTPIPKLPSLIPKLLPFGDFFMDWKEKDGDIITDRYFHAWSKRETFHLLKRAGFKSISLKSPIDKKTRNLIVIAEK